MEWNIESIPDLNDKIVVVTGGNSGLGYETCKVMAQKGATVVLASRSIENGEKAKKQIGETKGQINVMDLDLSDFSSIEKFAKQFYSQYDKLDILINNAGIMTTPYHTTKDGLEGQQGVNHFGHFYLTAKLFPALKKVNGARIVNVSSLAHKSGKMDFENLLFEKGNGYSPMKAYGRSKLENLLFTFELQRKIEKAGLDIKVAAAHPGVSQTNLARYLENKWWFSIVFPLFKAMTQSAAQGALPEICAATIADLKGGEYFGPDGKGERKGNPKLVDTTEAAKNKEDAQKLWELSEKLTGQTFDFQK